MVATHPGVSDTGRGGKFMGVLSGLGDGCSERAMRGLIPTTAPAAPIAAVAGLGIKSSTSSVVAARLSLRFSYPVLGQLSSTRYVGVDREAQAAEAFSPAALSHLPVVTHTLARHLLGHLQPQTARFSVRSRAPPEQRKA